jgi:hypothetical protein
MKLHGNDISFELLRLIKLVQEKDAYLGLSKKD